MSNRVVVVNDDPAVLALYRDMLSEIGWEPVSMATDGVETDRIRASNPDAVILDLQVGEQADYGVEMAKQLRGDPQYAAIPILVATAHALAIDGARETLREIGVPVLMKPFSVDELRSILDGRDGSGIGFR